jgi:hypothetical protein
VEQNGDIDVIRGQSTGNGVQFGSYQFVRSDVFESTSRASSVPHG